MKPRDNQSFTGYLNQGIEVSQPDKDKYEGIHLLKLIPRSTRNGGPLIYGLLRVEDVRALVSYLRHWLAVRDKEEQS